MSVRRGGHQVSGRHNGDGGREPTLICPKAVLGGNGLHPRRETAALCTSNDGKRGNAGGKAILAAEGRTNHIKKKLGGSSGKARIQGPNFSLAMFHDDSSIILCRSSCSKKSLSLGHSNVIQTFGGGEYSVLGTVRSPHRFEIRGNR